MVAYAFYEVDSRIRRYAEALVKRGDHVDAVCLRREGQPETGMLEGVHLFRVQQRVKNERCRLSHLWRLLRFLGRSARFLNRKHAEKNPYDIIHVHSVPDFEVFAAILPKLQGAKVILDIHDIVPEFYASKFNVDHGSFLFNALLFMEKLSSRFADHVLISNGLWLETLTSRSLEKDKCTVVLNYPDSSMFRPRPRTRKDGKFVMIYPGTLNWHQGVDIAVRAFHRIRESVPNAELQIYGDGYQKEALAEMIEELGLRDRVILRDFVPLEKSAEIMANADVGIVPKRGDSFGNEAFSTKTLEFMSLGVPVIASSTKVDRHYFDSSLVQFFEPGDEDDLARCMLLLAGNVELRNRLAANAMKYVSGLGWDRKKEVYFSIVDELAAKRPMYCPKEVA